jgi:clan AA aspartic protease (TIGR02281 family)
MRRFGLIVATLALASQAAAADDCRLVRQDSIPMIPLSDGHFAVGVTISGQPLRFAVDTGAPGMMITRRAANALGLTKSTLAGMSAVILGHTTTAGAQASEVTIGHTRPDYVQFFVAPAEMNNEESDGLLGASFLQVFEVDLDFAHARMNLFSKNHCPGKLVYWTRGEDVAVIPYQIERGHIAFPVTLDGKQITAVLDTGAWHTTIGLDDAKRMYGLDERAPDMRRDMNSQNPKPRYHHRFKSLAFGGVVIGDADVMLHTDTYLTLMSSTPRMLLGMNILRQLHIMIAYSEKKLYVTAAETQ